MLDIERISKKITEEKDNLVAKAFTCHISNLLLANGIVPIMTEHSFNDLEKITDSDRYKLVSKLGVTFESLDTSEHDKEIYNQALKEFEQKLISKIREDTCGCAYDARVIIRDTLDQMYK